MVQYVLRIRRDLCPVMDYFGLMRERKRERLNSSHFSSFGDLSRTAIPLNRIILFTSTNSYNVIKTNAKCVTINKVSFRVIESM